MEQQAWDATGGCTEASAGPGYPVRSPSATAHCGIISRQPALSAAEQDPQQSAVSLVICQSPLLRIKHDTSAFQIARWQWG